MSRKLVPGSSVNDIIVLAGLPGSGIELLAF